MKVEITYISTEGHQFPHQFESRVEVIECVNFRENGDFLEFSMEGFKIIDEKHIGLCWVNKNKIRKLKVV